MVKTTVLLWFACMLAASACGDGGTKAPSGRGGAGGQAGATGIAGGGIGGAIAGGAGGGAAGAGGAAGGGGTAGGGGAVGAASPSAADLLGKVDSCAKSAVKGGFGL